MDTEKSMRVLEKEIDLIQSCITRMSNNSFLVKGWTISLLAVIMALLPEKFDMRYLCTAVILIIIIFWYLDSFFLCMERLYRRKYAWVIKNRLSCDDFCYDLNPHNQNMWLPSDISSPNYISQWHVMFSRTLLSFYGLLLVLIVPFIFCA